MYPHLAPGYAVRHPTKDDIPAILALLNAYDIAETGEADTYEPEDIEGDWEDLEPTRDAWVVIAPDGLLCGYATLTPRPAIGRIYEDGYVHPLHYRRGIGTTLVELMEARAVEQAQEIAAETRIVLVNNIIMTSDDSRKLLEQRDYTLKRVFFRMHITLDAPPPRPRWPEGIKVRACDGSEEEVRRIYETVEDAFRDHWSHAPRSYEDWRSGMVRHDFDPSLWFLAYDGHELAGVALGRERDEGRGWIDQVSVRRPWRKRGIATALLQHSFGAFYERGIPRVGLAVDAQSLTGAQHIYESVGMQVTMRIGRYDKELRPGVDLFPE